MVAATTAGGLWLAPGHAGRGLAALAILGVVMIVAGANALNMYIEREIDGRMRRTRDRPLPAGRMAPAFAMWFGVVLSAAALPVLAFGVNLTTALLAALAHISYVLAYTPLKQKSHRALYVGAVAGAMPPLLGWTAVTGSATAGGLLLFGILYFWQVAHFLAISVFRQDEYAQGGLKILPNCLGVAATKHAIVRHTTALLFLSLLLGPMGILRPAFAPIATLLSVGFLAWGLAGLQTEADHGWARSLFFASLAYLTLLFALFLVQGVTA